MNERIIDTAKRWLSWPRRFFVGGIPWFLAIVVLSTVGTHLAAWIVVSAFGSSLTGPLLVNLVYPVGEEVGKLLGIVLVILWANAKSPIPLVAHFGPGGAALVAVSVFALAESSLYLTCGLLHFAPTAERFFACSLGEVPLDELLLRRAAATPGHLAHSMFLIVAVNEATRRTTLHWRALPWLALLPASASHITFNVAGSQAGLEGVLAWWRIGVWLLAGGLVYFAIRSEPRPRIPHVD